MTENIDFIQGKKEQYNPSEMQGGLFFSKDSKEILLNGDSYGNATPADEEDITAESGNLKLKDRAYDEASFSGKGYVILRKNIQEITVPKFDLTISSGCTTNGTITVTLGDSPTQVEVTTNASTPEAVAQLIQAAIPESTIEGAVVTFTSNPTLDYSTTGVAGSVANNSYQENRNILTQEMINNPNTVYEIRYDFDLNEAKITIPEGCTLKFNGGSLNNGTINFSDTYLQNANFVDIVFTGDIANTEIYCEWFTNSNNQYDTQYLSQFTSNISGKILHIGNRHIFLKSLIINQANNFQVIGSGNSIIDVDSSINRQGWEEVFTLQNSNSIIISNITFSDTTAGDSQYVGIMYSTPILRLTNCNIINIKGCHFYNMENRAAVDFTKSNNIILENNLLEEYDGGFCILRDKEENDEESISDPTIYNVIIRNNIFAGNYGWSEPIFINSDRIFQCIISGNIIRNKMKASGIMVSNNRSESSILISNNIVERVDTAFELTSVGTVNVKNNTLRAIGTTSLLVIEKTKCIFQENTIINGAIMFNMFSSFTGKLIYAGNYVYASHSPSVNNSDADLIFSNNTIERSSQGDVIISAPCRSIITNNYFSNANYFRITYKQIQDDKTKNRVIIKDNSIPTRFDSVDYSLINDSDIIDGGVNSSNRFLHDATKFTLSDYTGQVIFTNNEPGHITEYFYKYTGSYTVPIIATNNQSKVLNYGDYNSVNVQQNDIVYCKFIQLDTNKYYILNIAKNGEQIKINNIGWATIE